jgi:hypothetical protein
LVEVIDDLVLDAIEGRQVAGGDGGGGGVESAEGCADGSGEIEGLAAFVVDIVAGGGESVAVVNGDRAGGGGDQQVGAVVG